MAQYIDKSEVVAEIEKLQDWCKEHNMHTGIDLLEKLYYCIDNLEVKENVNLSEMYDKVPLFI